ncbi:hypothetical protein AT2G02497 [Arabidopsis thaliana]|uniref:Uncharacterized protein n=1 Tax=Arabidopsis thaliana TaxID=3702 RepID=A0A1P8AXS8_ARATH|nr:uncharacterized protein AT2G02497 [Arabidopsis thaliana]ANM61468.1 hypothetical protein AT2G02497 [Arabidopsis thaliana]|eukprot:NP_001323685.1 hypothetical protein AT2G02497 [Arabidopsis thaliana]
MKTLDRKTLWEMQTPQLYIQYRTSHHMEQFY